MTELWTQRAYESGTQIVTTDEPGEPWLYICYPGSHDDDDHYRIRWQMCSELAAFLNGGPRPAWLDDMRRVSETTLKGIDGSDIEAVGPMYDADPPNLNWRTCDDDESKNKRARLIDRLTF
jgi:hypothetical protein